MWMRMIDWDIDDGIWQASECEVKSEEHMRAFRRLNASTGYIQS